MNDIINKDIQVGNIEAKMASTGNMKYVITDSQKNKYYFFQKNKDKNTGQPVDCDVYQSFTGMNLKIGDTCNIGFTEEAKSFTNQKGELINYTDRFILGLREANGAVPSSAPSQPQTPRTVANPAPQRESSDAFSRRLGIQGHINALLSNHEVVAGLVLSNEVVKTVVQLAIQIEDEAEKQLNPSAFRQAIQAYAPQVVEPELPTIQVAPDIAEEARRMENGEIDVSDIPF